MHMLFYKKTKQRSARIFTKLYATQGTTIGMKASTNSMRLHHILTWICVIFFCGSSGAESLQEIYETALAQDPLIAAARATYRADSEARTQGRAALLPQISATGTYSDNTYEVRDLDSFFVQDNKTETESKQYSVNLTQAIFDLPAWYRFQRGKNLTARAKAQFAADQQDLIIRVSEAYFNVLRAFDDTKMREAEERAIKLQLDQTRERYQVGLVPITDVHEAQAAYDEATVNTLESQGTLRITFEDLGVLTGRKHEVLAGLDEQFFANPPDPVNSDDWVTFSLANNFQLKVAELAKKAAAHNAKAQKYQHLPKVNLALGYDKDRSDGTQAGVSGVKIPGFSGGALEATSRTIERETDNSGVRINVSMPIYSGGLIHSQRRQSAQQSVFANQNYIAAKRNTEQSTRSLHHRAVTNSARVKARSQSIISSTSALEATEAGYEVGTRNIVDVLIAQRALYRAKRNHANARYDFIMSMMLLRQMAGQLSPDDIYQINAWLKPELVVHLN